MQDQTATKKIGIHHYQSVYFEEFTESVLQIGYGTLHLRTDRSDLLVLTNRKQPKSQSLA